MILIEPTIHAIDKLQVELRTRLARKEADLENALAANATQALKLRQSEFKLADTSAALQAAEMQLATRTSEVAQTSQALDRESSLAAELRSQLKEFQEKLEKAEHWNNIQVDAPICDAFPTIISGACQEVIPSRKLVEWY